MNLLIKNRKNIGLSQRGLAGLSRVPFRTIQLLEKGGHDPQVSTLERIAAGLGYPPKTVQRRLDSLFGISPDSVAVISESILVEREDSWKAYLFNLVDAFRNDPRRDLIDTPPLAETVPRIKALLASVVEALCEERGMPQPEWCFAVPSLFEPWFVSGMESLKAAALVESPVHFRKRNIFVLGNFLSRA